MLTIIEGGSGIARDTELYNIIKKSVGEGTPTLLIVPESQTVLRERQAWDTLPESAGLTFEVTNFTRFADSFFRRYGGLAGEYSDRVKNSLIMWKALVELKGLTSLTQGAKVKVGTVEKAERAIKDMQSLGLGAEGLIEYEEQAMAIDRRLGRKIRDLSLIYATYKRLLGEKYCDREDDLFTMCGKIDENPLSFSGYEIIITDFTSFTEPQYELIKRLIKGSNVTVALDLPRFAGDSFTYTETVETKKRLIKIANLTSDLAYTHKVKNTSDFSETLPEICRHLWSQTEEFDNSCLQNANINIYEAETPFEECSFIATDIALKVMEGASYSDFAIVAKNTTIYDGIIDEALREANVPYFYAKDEDISTYEAVRMISSAYAVVLGGFKNADVISFAKSPLSGLSYTEADELELYCEKWGITGARFTDGIDWNMNPKGYVPMAEGDGAKLTRINEARERVIKPLCDFNTNIRNAKTVKEQSSSLISLLLSLNTEQRLMKEAEELRKIGETEAAEKTERLWQIICDALDTLVDVLGDCEIAPDSFSSLLFVVFSGTSISSIPTRRDKVSVISASSVRGTLGENVYLIGVNEGEFPGTARDDSYFTEREKIKLSSLGLAIDPDLDRRTAREYYMFSRAFCSARSTVNLLYSKKNTKGAQLKAAEPISTLVKLSDGKIAVEKISALPLGRKIYSTHSALTFIKEATDNERRQVESALYAVGDGELVKMRSRSSVNDNLSLTDEGLAYIYRGDLYLSQTRIDTFKNCPMNYFLRYNLKLDEGERAELGNNIIGSFIHSILENFFLTLKENGTAVTELDAEKRLKLTERSAKKYLSEAFGEAMNQKRTEVAISRLTRAALPVVEGLCDEFSDCEFKPVFFELKTDGGAVDLPDPVVFDTEDGYRTIINGTVDRVDAFIKDNNAYVRVIDYKTGAKDFKPDDMKEGKNLQMFLYLKAITETEKPAFLEKLGINEDGKIIPAGVIYVKTRVKDVTVDLPSDELATAEVKRIQERQGMLLDEAESLSAMNANYLPVKFKGGEVDARSRKYLFDTEGWKNISEDLGKVINSVSMDMKKGNINATNSDKSGQSACGYCGFRSVCRNYNPKKFFT
jgi:ATP-dependent helicase/nuclease subunit B